MCVFGPRRGGRRVARVCFVACGRVVRGGRRAAHAVGWVSMGCGGGMAGNGSRSRWRCIIVVVLVVGWRVCVWAVATSDGQRRSLMYRVAVWHRVCCCSAIALTTGVPVTGTNMGATYQSGEQAAVANSGGSSTIWYTWTPASSASFTVTTANSAFDTTLAVYRVTASGNLYRVSGAADYTIPLVEECATHTTQARSLSRMGVC